MPTLSKPRHILPRKFRDNRRVETIRARPYESDEVQVHQPALLQRAV